MYRNLGSESRSTPAISIWQVIQFAALGAIVVLTTMLAMLTLG